MVLNRMAKGEDLPHSAHSPAPEETSLHPGSQELLEGLVFTPQALPSPPSLPAQDAPGFLGPSLLWTAPEQPCALSNLQE